MATNNDKPFAPGFFLVIDGLLAARDSKATTPEEALTTLLQSKHGYRIAPGTNVRVFRIMAESDDAITELSGEQVELDPLIATEKVLRRIYTSSLTVTIDFRFDVLPGENIPGYADLLREIQEQCPRVQHIRLQQVAMTDDIHICDEECEFFGTRDPKHQFTGEDPNGEGGHMA